MKLRSHCSPPHDFDAVYRVRLCLIHAYSTQQVPPRCILALLLGPLPGLCSLRLPVPLLQVKPYALEQHRYLQLLNERCELMSLLTHLYVGADALTPHTPAQSQLSHMTLSPDIYSAQTLLAQITSKLSQDDADDAASDALTSALTDLVNMSWPTCSEQQFLQLLERLGSAVYTASAGAAAATAPSAQLPWAGTAGRVWLAAAEPPSGGGSANGGGGKSQAMELQQLSEALVSWDGGSMDAHKGWMAGLFWVYPAGSAVHIQ